LRIKSSFSRDSIAAKLMSVFQSKTSLTTLTPCAEEEFTFTRPLTPDKASSIGLVTLFSMPEGDSSANLVTTVKRGKDISGNNAVSRRNNPKQPSSIRAAPNIAVVTGCDTEN